MYVDASCENVLYLESSHSVCSFAPFCQGTPDSRQTFFLVAETLRNFPARFAVREALEPIPVGVRISMILSAEAAQLQEV